MSETKEDYSERTGSVCVGVFPPSLLFSVPHSHHSLYLVFLPLDGALQLVQLVLQLSDDVRLGLNLVKLCLPLALQQGTLHLCLEGQEQPRLHSYQPELKHLIP